MIVIVMGVSGCGKSTVAAHMAKNLNIDFLDADDLHPPENKQIMSTGIALTDENRLPWLNAVRDFACSQSSLNKSCVIACSALKRSYRHILSEAPSVSYVFLDGPKSLIQQRMRKRAGHFMPASLLDSQYEALENPSGESNVVTISIKPTPELIARDAIAALKKNGFFQ